MISTVLCRNESKITVIIKIITTGISQLHKAGNGCSHRFDKCTFQKLEKLLIAIHFAEAVVLSTIATPINKNQDPSMSLDGII